jgi:cytochrome c-type biogenesis protein
MFLSPVTLPLSFMAGVLSFISPCVLPLVPVYLSYLSGSALLDVAHPSRRRIFGHALLFVGGFTFVFITLFGLPTTVLGNLLREYSNVITRIGGAVVILFGVHTLGIISIPFLNATRRLEMTKGMERSHFRSVLFGVAFAAGWTPCIGPLLGTVMTLALTTPSQAVGFILAYALGLAIPFLATAALVTRAVPWLKRLNRHMRMVEVISGLMMIAVGLVLISGKFALFNSYLIRLAPEWLYKYL